MIYDEQQQVVFQKKDNYQSINRIIFDQPLHTKQLTIAVEHPSKNTPAAIFEVYIVGAGLSPDLAAISNNRS